MATTQNTYTGDGTTVLFSFTFPYIDDAHIKVTLDGVATTEYTLANATTIQFNSAPGAGVAVRIYRESDVESPESTFYPASAIRAEDLNDNFLQSLYLNQETRAIAVEASTGAIPDGSIGTAKLATSAVTTDKISPASVTEAKLATDSVSTAKIQSGAVTSTKVANDAIGTTAIQNAAVTNAKIGTAAVNTSNIADSAVTAVKTALTSLLNYVYYTTAGSGTYTPTAGTKRILVEVWGGGGGGGGADGQGASTWAKGVCGGGGGYCSKWLASGLDASYSYTVGAGGAGGLAGGGEPGAVGGTSTFSGTGVSLSAEGGGAGSGASGSASGNNTSGSVGGNATGGDINIKGGMSHSIITTSATIRTGIAGSGYSFPQANWVGGLSPSSGFAGQDAFNPAEGGGGAGSRDVATNYAGGAGGPGLIKITEYFI